MYYAGLAAVSASCGQQPDRSPVLTASTKILGKTLLMAVYRPYHDVAATFITIINIYKRGNARVLCGASLMSGIFISYSRNYL